VTRFDEFSPIGRLFTLASCLKVAKKLLAVLVHGKGDAFILAKIGLATFWAIF
jgi:hypothetical protein